MTCTRDSGSFRDPAGFVFHQGGQLYRQVNRSYRANYEHLMQSGLYANLTRRGILVAHRETRIPPLDTEGFLVLQPEVVPFISYPYEWSFGQLRAAALVTLEVQKAALKHGMTMKDASAYNIQFRGSKPVFIDTLSFELYQEDQPWVAYRQFCQQFLAPLALMSHTDLRLGLLLKSHLDGIPLDLASKLLPWRTRLQSGLLVHLHLHAGRLHPGPKAERTIAKPGSMSRNAMLGLVHSLLDTVRELKSRSRGGEWVDYYAKRPSYETLTYKDEVVKEMLRMSSPDTVWDLGANTGRYTWIASELGANVIALDADATCAQVIYEDSVAKESSTVLPLVMDLTNPSPSLGSEGTERSSLFQRGPADTVLGLALLHHLAIGNNLPLASIARMFHVMGRYVIVEFVPQDDPMVKKMMVDRNPEGVPEIPLRRLFLRTSLLWILFGLNPRSAASTC